MYWLNVIYVQRQCHLGKRNFHVKNCLTLTEHTLFSCTSIYFPDLHVFCHLNWFMSLHHQNKYIQYHNSEFNLRAIKMVVVHFVGISSNKYPVTCIATNYLLTSSLKVEFFYCFSNVQSFFFFYTIKEGVLSAFLSPVVLEVVKYSKQLYFEIISLITNNKILKRFL